MKIKLKVNALLSELKKAEKVEAKKAEPRSKRGRRAVSEQKEITPKPVKKGRPRRKSMENALAPR